jgi:putative tricarboxylic transport membrane protein
MSNVIEALDMLLNFQTLFWVVVGSILGIILGALPGLTATMGVALMLPVSIYLPTATGMAMLLAVYSGAIGGASIPAILLGIPGNPNALATVEDGYRMTQKGLGGLALGSAAVASLIGGLLSLLLLIVFAPLLAKATLAFGPAEKFGLAVLGLAVIASISAGNMIKGVAMGAFGISLSLIGPDPFTNAARVPFPQIFAETPLYNGIELVPALIGLFGISQALLDLERMGEPAPALTTRGTRNLFPSLRKLSQMWRIILESTGIGTLIGAIPGTGASIAVFLAHGRAKTLTSNPRSRLDKVGTGCVEGVFAPEVANNAVSGGALIPVLTLGIPGDAATAVLLGALLVKGVVPGSELFSAHLSLVYAIFFGMGFSLIAMFIFQLVGVRLFPYVLKIPSTYLIPIIILLSFIGTFAIDGQAVVKATYNMGVALALGVTGYLFKRADYPISPLVLGLILGNMLETNFRLAIKLAQGNYFVFFQSPIVLGMLAAIVVAFSWPALMRIGRRHSSA